MRKLNFIDVFAGASGMSEGFVRAGFTPIAHVEMDKSACQTIQTRAVYHYLSKKNNLEPYYDYLQSNISKTELYKLVPKRTLQSVLNYQISDKNINEIFDKIDSELKTKKIDLLIGGPPCQAYSLLGRHHDKIENDPRNKLYIHYGRFLNKYDPLSFVFENVPGILSANQGKHFINLKKYFRKLGYEVFYRKIDSSNYGVLQARKRIIIVGWKKEYSLKFPHIKEDKSNFVVNDIFSDLPNVRPGTKQHVFNYSKPINRYLENSTIRNGIDFITQHETRNHNDRDLAIYRIAINKWNHENKRLKYTDLPKQLQSHKNTTSFLDRFKVVNGNGYSHTVVAHISKDGHYYIHPSIEQCRSISVREAARLQSFPDTFHFEGSRTARFKQIGNAVPPLLSYAIAKSMKKNLCSIIK